MTIYEDFDKRGEGEEEIKKVVFNPEKHIMLDEAKKKEPSIKPGEELEIPLVSKQDYGRIAAQTAKQVILQKIREAEIQTIAREAGFRTKIAVASTDERIDPIGSCVGQRGTRIIAVINELGGEKIDVILWEENPEKFIANALSPAKVSEVRINDKNTAV